MQAYRRLAKLVHAQRGENGVCFADDALAENAVENLLKFALQRQCDIVMGAYRSVLGADAETHHYLNENKVFEGSECDKFCEDMLRPQRGIALAWGKLYRMSVLRSIQGFNESLSLGEDAEFAFRACVVARRIGYVDAMAYEYRRNAQSAVRTFRTDYVRRTVKGIEALQDTVRQMEPADTREAYMQCLDDYALFTLGPQGTENPISANLESTGIPRAVAAISWRQISDNQTSGSTFHEMASV